MSEDAEIEAAIEQAQAIISRPDWQEAVERGDYAAMRGVLKAGGVDENLIDIILIKITGYPQRFIWWQSLLKGSVVVAAFWGLSYALEKPLAWPIWALLVAGIVLGDFWHHKKKKSK